MQGWCGDTLCPSGRLRAPSQHKASPDLWGLLSCQCRGAWGRGAWGRGEGLLPRWLSNLLDCRGSHRAGVGPPDGEQATSPVGGEKGRKHWAEPLV